MDRLGVLAQHVGHFPASSWSAAAPGASPVPATAAARSTAAAAMCTRCQQRLDGSMLNARGQLEQVVYTPAGAAAGDGGSLELGNHILIEDDAPAIGKPHGAADDSWFESLVPSLVARKLLLLPEIVAASRATLLLNMKEGPANTLPLRIVVNGHVIVRPPSREALPHAPQYFDPALATLDKWYEIDVPVSALRSGLNEVLISADHLASAGATGDSGWQLMVASADEYERGGSRRCPGRSGKSVGDKAFVSDRLGSASALSGEYCVRLALAQHVAEGRYRSPALDLLAVGSWLEDHAPAAGATPMLPAALSRGGCAARSVQLRPDCVCPSGTQLELRLRTGAQPRLEATGWSEWQHVASGVEVHIPAGHRFAQIEAELSTTAGFASPSLHALEVTVETIAAPAESALPIARVVGGEHYPVVRPSVVFAHEDYMHPELQQLRRDWQLDDMVAGTSEEFEAQLRLLRWAYTAKFSQWGKCNASPISGRIFSCLFVILLIL